MIQQGTSGLIPVRQFDNAEEYMAFIRRRHLEKKQETLRILRARKQQEIEAEKSARWAEGAAERARQRAEEERVRVLKEKMARELNSLRQAEAMQRKIEEARNKALEENLLGAANQMYDTMPREVALYLEALPGQSMARITRRICKATKVLPSEIVGRSRLPRIVFARQAVCYWTLRLTSMTFKNVGRKLNRDHTTALHGGVKYPEKRAKQGRYLPPLKSRAHDWNRKT